MEKQNLLEALLKKQVGKSIFLDTALIEDDVELREGLKERLTRYSNIFNEEEIGGIVNAEFTPYMSAKYWLYTTVRPDGSLPVLSTDLRLTSEDLRDSIDILRHYPEQFGEILKARIQECEKYAKHIEKTIEKYERGIKPSADDILHARDKSNGGSISEPILQDGTPEEGLTSEVYTVTYPYRIKHADFINKSLKKVKGITIDKYTSPEILFGDYDTIVKARNLADRYLKFISDNCGKNPGIRHTIADYKKRDNDITQKQFGEALEKYSDIEWEKRDEALDIARRLKTLYGRNIKYLSSLKGGK